MVQPTTDRRPTVDFDHHDQTIAGRIHEVYRDLRSENPIQWSDHHGGFWIATGYGPIQAIASAPDDFTSEGALIPDMTGGNALVPQMLQDPEHRLYRTLLREWFTPRRIASFEPALRDLSAEKLAALESPVDVAAEYALSIPMEMILRVVGVQEHNMDLIRDGVRYMVDQGGQDPTGATDAWRTAMSFVKEVIIAPLRESPGDDLLSYLLKQQTEVSELTDDVIAAIGFSMIGAGFDTTYKTLSTTLAYFAANPDVQAQARKSPSAQIVEEALRLFAPVATGRTVHTDTEVAGQALKAGERILLALPAANRDPLEFSEPDEPHFDRNNVRHLTFGSGIHKCLGMHLARLELRVAIEEVFRAFDDFRIAPGQEVRFVQSQVWGAVSVPIVFSRARND
ncbi:cytochrome P450 [Mycolicibacterium stellerae]|uniref:cytochrome P450 n=1 Tax=Mycolicibacterium stellerae TaxID=2358193 RepID=UPI0013DE5942|nr:cytochrome P450 [Mycolicibacterium stellerae]